MKRISGLLNKEQGLLGLEKLSDQNKCDQKLCRQTVGI